MGSGQPSARQCSVSGQVGSHLRPALECPKSANDRSFANGRLKVRKRCEVHEWTFPGSSTLEHAIPYRLLRTTITIDDELFEKASEMADPNMDRSAIFKTSIQVQIAKRLIALGGSSPREARAAAPR